MDETLKTFLVANCGCKDVTPSSVEAPLQTLRSVYNTYVEATGDKAGFTEFAANFSKFIKTSVANAKRLTAIEERKKDKLIQAILNTSDKTDPQYVALNGLPTESLIVMNEAMQAKLKQNRKPGIRTNDYSGTAGTANSGKKQLGAPLVPNAGD